VQKFGGSVGAHDIQRLADGHNVIIPFDAEEPEASHYRNKQHGNAQAYSGYEKEWMRCDYVKQ
jgi:hypothetical protein